MQKQQLVDWLDDGNSLKGMARLAGISVTAIRYWLKKYGLKANNKIRKWTDSQMVAAIHKSETISDVLRDVGLAVRPGNYVTVNNFINLNNINVSHMTGKKHGRGGRKMLLKDVLVENSTYARHHLKKRLLKSGLLKNRCEECDLNGQWKSKPLVMILDHKNGIHNDNRIENLRMICPNCNSQQMTFCRGSR